MVELIQKNEGESLVMFQGLGGELDFPFEAGLLARQVLGGQTGVEFAKGGELGSPGKGEPIRMRKRTG